MGDVITNIPTLNEYFTQKINSIRENAFNKSVNRLMPNIPTTKGKKSKEEKLNELLKSKQNLEKQLSNTSLPNFFRQQNNNALNSVIDKINNFNNWYDSEYIGEGAIEGPSCAYTAADNYNMNFKGSEQFRQSADKFGFKEIPYDQVQRGDIVLNYDGNRATHTMNYAGKDETGTARFNHSNGGIDQASIRKNAKYPFKNGNKPLTYTFVGTPSDSIKWENEYNNKYNNYYAQYKHK